MRLTTTLIGLSVLVAVALGTAATNSAPPATRLIGAEIQFDGRVVLRASTSDDGHPDVDAVWDYQRTDLVYAPTGEFAALGVPGDAQEWTLESAPHLPATGNQPARRRMQVQVDVGHGGTVSAYELRLVRVPRSAHGAEWRIHTEDLERLFPYRTITRDQASRLKAPKRTR